MNAMSDQASKLLRIVGMMRDIADQESDYWRGELRQLSNELEALASAHSAEGVGRVLDVDALANFIRSIDGNHSLGAGALAEKIFEWTAAPPPPKVPDDVAKDAARYRWLRNPDQDVGLVIDKCVGEHERGLHGEFNGYKYEYRESEELDTAIDAAMLSASKAAANG